MAKWGGFFQKLEIFGNFCYSEVCHQQTDRTLRVFGKQTAVCARCAGVYFGFLGGLIIWPGSRHFLAGRMRNDRYWFFGFIPMAIDFTVSHLGMTPSGNWIRLWTGIAAGFSSAYLILPGWMEINFKK